MILDRTKAPDFIIPDKISLTKPIKRTLKNGVPLYFIHTPNIDAIRLEVITEANKPLLPTEKSLTSFFTLHMLLEGTRDLPGSKLDDFFDYYATEVDVISNFEQNGLSLLTTRKHFSSVLPVFRSLFTEATFPEKELLKKKSQKELTISIQSDQNSARANQLYRMAMFGKNHPFGFIAEDFHVHNIVLEDLFEFYKNNFLVYPEIFVTGNLDEPAIDGIEREFGDLEVKKIGDFLPSFELHFEKRITEKKEKSVQSSIRMGQHLISKKDPDYYGLSVFNTILGGYFGSRLIKNIREDKGHTYGIYSSIGSLKNSDYWVVMADVQKGFSDEVVEEVYKEIDLLSRIPVDDMELEIVRNYMVGNFLSNFSSPFDLINKFKSIHQQGLDYGFYENQLDYIKNFKREDILKIGQKYFDRDNIKEVLVGSL